MTLYQTYISTKGGRGKSAGLQSAIDDYVARTAAYCACEQECFRDEAAFFNWIVRSAGRTPQALILLDPRGKQLSSEAFAEVLRGYRDKDVQKIVLAVGPANGWGEPSRERAQLLLSLGPMTLPHELARVVLAEQVYRAQTILAGHPYHCGH